MKKSALVLSFFSLFVLASCSSTPSSSNGLTTNSYTSESFGGTALSNNETTMENKDCNTVQTDMPEKGDDIAVIATNKGTIKVRLFPCDAPDTVKNFTELAKKGYYDGVTFHRVIKDFMIQGGDPTGTGSGGETADGELLKDEFSKDLTHIKGALSMANTGRPMSGSSQFFIVHAKDGTSWLNGKHSVFGQVIEGQDIVDTIAVVETQGADKPVEDVVMEKVTIEQY